MTEKEQLLAMLAHADVKGWQELSIYESDPDIITVHTGADDAVAVFGFGQDGKLVSISVDEC